MYATITAYSLTQSQLQIWSKSTKNEHGSFESVQIKIRVSLSPHRSCLFPNTNPKEPTSLRVVARWSHPVLSSCLMWQPNNHPCPMSNIHKGTFSHFCYTCLVKHWDTCSLIFKLGCSGGAWVMMKTEWLANYMVSNRFPFSRPMYTVCLRAISAYGRRVFLAYFISHTSWTESVCVCVYKGSVVITGYCWNFTHGWMAIQCSRSWFSKTLPMFRAELTQRVTFC